MSKIIRTRKPSVLPYYAAALVFVVLCAVLPVYRLWALAAALAAAAAAFLAAKKVCPPRVVETEVPFHTGVEDVDAMLADIQQKPAWKRPDAPLWKWWRPTPPRQSRCAALPTTICRTP